MNDNLPSMMLRFVASLGAGFAAIIVGTWGALIGFGIGWVVFK